METRYLVLARIRPRREFSFWYKTSTMPEVLRINEACSGTTSSKRSNAHHGFLDKLEIHDPLRRDEVDSNVVHVPSADFPFIFRRRQARRGLTQGQSLPNSCCR